MAAQPIATAFEHPIPADAEWHEQRALELSGYKDSDSSIKAAAHFIVAETLRRRRYSR